MKFSTPIAIACLSSISFASPIHFYQQEETNNSTTSITAVEGESIDYLDAWYDFTYPDIKNCNATQVKMINKYYQDLLEVSSVARSHLISNGANDTIFQHWFGESGNPLTVLGVIDNIVQGDKDGALYRCDDADGNCAEHLTDWAGYHRENVTEETVLCDLFFTSKKPIEQMCVIGDILTVTPKKFAGIDLVHRFLHLESINKGFVGEYVEDFDEIVDYAEHNSTYAVLNTDNILYYLAESYAAELTNGGCLGDYLTDNSKASN